MNDLTTGISWLDHLILWAVVLAALGGGLAVVKNHILPLFRALTDFLSDWSGQPERPGVPERLGVMARLEANDEQMRLVRHELHPNGGDSLRDAVDFTVAAAKDAAAKAEVAADMAAQTKASLDEHVEQSKELLEQGRKSEASIVARQDAQDKVIADLADALPVVARSTPAKEDQP